jgi:NAD(P) transhydrogenase subunit alpha
MTVGVPRERYPGERRVSLVPAHVPALSDLGVVVAVERSAGERAGYPDEEYVDRGATLVDSRADVVATSDVVLTVRWGAADTEAFSGDLASVQENSLFLGFVEPYRTADYLQDVLDAGISLLAVELVPRITRAQSMDALSSMANLAGYKAALIGADHLPRIFPMMMTAAGTLTPARVFVVGVGVAGLQAIATAKRLGAVVSAYDIRPAVREQVESLGARFVEVPLETDASESSGGYAREMNEEFYRKQRELMTETIADSDLVITTAAVPGKKSPILVTEEMVQAMSGGSVIVDLAAERGGNCELTEAGKTVVRHEVTIIGPINLPSSLAYHASQLYSKNLLTLLQSLIREGRLELDLEDEILRSAMVAHDGKIVSPAIESTIGG